jgi:ribosomal protein S13
MKDELLSGVDIPKVKIIGYDDDGESAIKMAMTKISDLGIDKKIVNLLTKQGITHLVDMLLQINNTTKIKGISNESMDQLRKIMKQFDPKDKAILKEANIRVKYL